MYQYQTPGYSLLPLHDSNDQCRTLTVTISKETSTPEFPTTPAISSDVNATNAPKSPLEIFIPSEKPCDATREEPESREDDQGIVDINKGNGALSSVPLNCDISPEGDSDSTLTAATHTHSRHKKRKNPAEDDGYISHDEDDMFSSDEDEEFEERLVEELEEEVEEM
jgi:hypothetical protein